MSLNIFLLGLFSGGIVAVAGISLLNVFFERRERKEGVKMINQNDLAVEITKREGKKVQVGIGQVKEILKITLSLLAKHDIKEIEKLLKKHS